MINNGPSPGREAIDRQPRISANEQAIIDSVRNPMLRSIFRHIWLTKLRLQFSGWLQYVPPALIMLVVFLAAGLGQFLGFVLATRLLALGGCVLLALQIFDLVTVKFRLRFPEPLPQRRDDLDLFDLMRSRRSCRSFQTRQLSPADHTELMESVRRHSAEPKIGQSRVRFEYVSAPLTVWPTVNASEFLVAITPKAYDRLAIIEVGRSLEKIVMDATRMGLGTCWIGPGADQGSIVHHLGERFNEEEGRIICVCAVGYASRYIPLFIRVFNARLYQRLPLSALFFADPQLKQPLDVSAAPYNRFGRTFEICQWAPSSYNGQTTRGVAVCRAGEPRLERFDFYAVTGSHYYAPVAVGIWCANWELGCEELGIQGHFAHLPAAQRGAQDEQALPRYDLSWVLDEGLETQ